MLLHIFVFMVIFW